MLLSLPAHLHFLVLAPDPLLDAIKHGFLMLHFRLILHLSRMVRLATELLLI